MKKAGKDLLRSTSLDTRLRTIERLRDKIYDPVNIPPYPSKTFNRNQQNRWEAKLNRMRLDAISKYREGYAKQKAVEFVKKMLLTISFGALEAGKPLEDMYDEFNKK